MGHFNRRALVLALLDEESPRQRFDWCFACAGTGDASEITHHIASGQSVDQTTAISVDVTSARVLQRRIRSSPNPQNA